MDRNKFHKLRCSIRNEAIKHFQRIKNTSYTPITKEEMEGFVQFRLGRFPDPNVRNGVVKFIENDVRFQRLVNG